MLKNPLALTIRTKKLAVLIRDARQSSGKSAEECAHALGVPQETYQKYELGEAAPSLPELEILACVLGLPPEHFWTEGTLSAGDGAEGTPDYRRAALLRRRRIGLLLRSARQEAGLSLDEMAEKTIFSGAQLEAYELGEEAIPFPALEMLSRVLDRPVDEFLDRHGPLGEEADRLRALKYLHTFPPELRAFVADPARRPYLELAQRLSEIDKQALHSLAESLMKIA